MIELAEGVVAVVQAEANEMNNPTLCEVLIDGRRCNELSSYVLKTAHVTRLCCFDCAQRYKSEIPAGAGRAPVPIMEFSLMELIPAREALEVELKTLHSQLAVADEGIVSLRSQCLQRGNKLEWALDAWGTANGWSLAFVFFVQLLVLLAVPDRIGIALLSLVAIAQSAVYWFDTKPRFR